VAVWLDEADDPTDPPAVRTGRGGRRLVAVTSWATASGLVVLVCRGRNWLLERYR
jgi:hypothetical protein